MFKKVCKFSLLVFTMSLLSNAYVNRNSIPSYLLDYSNGENIQVLTGGDLLEKILGKEITTAEKNLLSADKYSLAYTPNVNKSAVNLGLFEGEYLVEAKTYSYKVGNKVYEWTPVAVKQGSNSYTFNVSNNQYIAKVGSNSAFSVEYSLNINVDFNKVNSIINTAYYLGKTSSEDFINATTTNASLKKQYDAEMAVYNKAVHTDADFKVENDAYENYLKQKQDYQDYLAYLEEKKQYDAEMVVYNNYLKDLETYNADVAKYNKYLFDKQYYDDNHEQNLKDYNSYKDKLDSANHCLSIMDILFTKYGDLQTSLYDCIMSGAVDQALGKRELIITTANVEAALFDKCETATKNCRTYLTEYHALTTKKEQYSYYRYRYEKIRKNFYGLFRYLDKLIRNDLVANAAQSYGKLEKLQLMIAELAYFSNAIEDNVVGNYESYNEFTDKVDFTKTGAKKVDSTSYKIGGKTYPEWLKNSNLLNTELKAYPLKIEYPENEVVLLVEPTEVKEPTKPTLVLEPTKPVEVGETTDPTPVEKPTLIYESNKPAEPNYVVIDNTYADLRDAYDSKLLSLRYEYSENIPVVLTDTFEVTNPVTKNIAKFFDNSGALIYQSFFTTGAEFNGIYPTKNADAHFNNYDFDVWVDNDGNPVELSTLNNSCNLYPTFKGSDAVFYNVRWYIDDVNYIDTNVKDGVLPVFSEIPEKADLKTSEKHVVYIFSKWDKEIVEIDGADQEYHAIYEEETYYEVDYQIDHVSYKKMEFIEGTIVTPITLPEGSNYVWEFDFDNASPLSSNLIVNAHKLLNYTITWVYGPFSIKEVYEEGQIPVSPIDKFAKNDDQYYYEFINWNSPISAVTKDTTYTALVKKIPIANVDSTILTVDYNAADVILDCAKINTNSVSIKGLLSIIKSSQTISIKFADCSIYLDSEQVNLLKTNKVEKVGYNLKNLNNGYYNFEVVLSNQEKTSIAIDTDVSCAVKVQKPETSFVYLSEEKINSKTDENNCVSFKAKVAKKYEIIQFFEVDYHLSGSATIQADKEFVKPGEKVTVKITLNEGYLIVDSYALTDSGEKIYINKSDQFTMPYENVTLYVETEKQVFKVTFYVDGEVYSQYNAEYGTGIMLPDDPSKESTELYEYTFIGWGDVANEVTSDLNLIAQFEEKEIFNGSGTDKKLIALYTTILVGGIVLFAGAIITPITILIVRKKHSKNTKSK